MNTLSVLFTLLTLSFQAAQPVVVPVGKEPRHHVKFANKYVRVIDASVPPGDTTLFHTHAADNIPVAISSGELRTILMGSNDAPAVTNIEVGRTWWAPGSYTHQITNIGKTPVRFIDAEILTSPGTVADAGSLAEIPGHSLLFENERVRVYKVVLDPGQASGMHKHARSYLNVSISGGRIEAEGADKKKKQTKIKPGAFVWIDGPTSHAISNGGQVRYEAVDIELK